MKAIQLPEELINSLTSLGLLESEAKIYVALVLLNYANVGDLLQILDISKPRIYTSLGTLEEKGLIIQTSPRPVIYQAVTPKIALDMILKNYKDARDEALKQFKELEQQDLISKPPPPIFYILGDKNLEFKIKDMIESATKKVYCQTSEKYLKYVKKLAKKEEIKLNLTLLSENTEVKIQLENLFSGNAQIQLRNLSSMTENRMRTNEDVNRQYSILAELADMDNFFLLIVDENEALIVPPLKSNSLSALTTTNKAIILFITQIFLMSQTGTFE